MTKNHLKRISSPRTWKIERKSNTFISRPNPGPHSLPMGMPLNIVLRDLLKFAHTSYEVKKILQGRSVLVDGVRRRDIRFPAGMMDVISFPDIQKDFRVLFNEKGHLNVIPIDRKESHLKPCKIIGKSRYKGKYQICFIDGRTLLVDKNTYKVGDTLVLEIPKQDVKEHLPFGKDMSIYLIGGKHIGDTGKVEDIRGDKIRYKSKKGEVYETLKEYAFVVGKDKPAIKLTA